MAHGILIIDDDDSFIHSLERWLRDAGYSHLRFVSSGSQAVAALRENVSW